MTTMREARGAAESHKLDLAGATPAPAPISARGLGARFGRSVRWGTERMREMRHVRIGRELFTTEEWLAEFIAARSIPQTNWPPSTNMDPLEETVKSVALQVIGELARVGQIEVKTL